MDGAQGQGGIKISMNEKDEKKNQSVNKFNKSYEIGPDHSPFRLNRKILEKLRRFQVLKPEIEDYKCQNKDVFSATIIYFYFLRN